MNELISVLGRGPKPGAVDPLWGWACGRIHCAVACDPCSCREWPGLHAADRGDRRCHRRERGEGTRDQALIPNARQAAIQYFQHTGIYLINVEGMQALLCHSPLDSSASCMLHRQSSARRAMTR